MMTGVDAVTALVLTGKVALVAPAATVITLEGRLAALLLLKSKTWAPLAGAGPLNVTVQVEDCMPPTTVIGLSVREERITLGVPAGKDCSKIRTAGFGSLSETATNFEVEMT
jgi:hypothetical protein